MTLSSRHEDKNGNLFGMDAQGDALDDMRVEASSILQMQYERGNNGFVKRKYVTLTIEAENLPAARARFSRIEADTLNRFKVMGAGARVLDGKERLALLHGLLHPEGERLAFEWGWLPASGLSVKDFIAPSSFEFGETRRFRVGEMYGAVSFLQILAPEIQDRILTDFMDVEGNLLVTMHVRSINQNEAIKMVKRKITDLDAMKIQEQKKAAAAATIWIFSPPTSPPTAARQKIFCRICRAATRECSIRPSSCCIWRPQSKSWRSPFRSRPASPRRTTAS